jgi:poly-beta-1,6 N-acetyl-D-glucosamine synthase
MSTAAPLLLKTRLRFRNVSHRKSEGNRGAQLLRLIAGSGAASLVVGLVILYTLPRTVLTVEGLIVHASGIALALFLLALLFRYCTVLSSAFIFVARNSPKTDRKFIPFVSIIIPAYNEAKILQQSVESLIHQDYERFEIIIVNDGSTDDTTAVAEALAGYRSGKYGPIRIVLIDKPNGGKASALNAGVQYSTADLVLCMDGDSQLAPETLRVSVRHFLDPSVGAVAGNVKVLNRRKIISTLQALEYVEGLNLLRSAQSALGMVSIIPGPIGVFRKEAIGNAGWYSDDTFAEDADLTLNLRLSGWKILYEPRAISYTEAPESLHQLLKQRYRWTRGILQSLRKHRRELFRPLVDFKNTLVLWSLFYEAIIWPTMNIFANLFFIIVGLFFGLSTTIILWWASMALLDVMTALYCVAVDREELRLVLYAIVYRMVFILIVDITKAAATVEEFLGVDMTWGKLERIGASSL